MREKRRVTVDCRPEDDCCCPEYEKECNVNLILERIMRSGGEIPKPEAPVYADVSEIGDYVTQMTRVNEGRRIFDSLPADVKAKFGGNCQLLFDFMATCKSDDEMKEVLGLDVSASIAKMTSHSNSDLSESVDGKEDTVVNSNPPPQE